MKKLLKRSKNQKYKKKLQAKYLYIIYTIIYNLETTNVLILHVIINVNKLRICKNVTQI